MDAALPSSPAQPWNQRIPTILLVITMIFTGAAGLIYEYVLSTVSTFILGNSVEQFSVTIALMLFMMGIAGAVQKNFRDEGLIEKFIIAEVLLAILGGFAPIAFYASFATMEHHFALVQYGFIMAIGFLVGIEIPLAMRINERFVRNLGGNIANIWAADYVGAFIGALVWTFYLLRNFPLTEIGFLVAAINIVVATITFGYFSWQSQIKHVVGIALALVCTFGALGYGYANNRVWNEKLEQKLYDDPIVVSKTTRYQRIVVTKAENPEDYRLYLNGNLQFASVDEHVYHESLVHPVMAVASSRKRVLVLGGGDGLALREILKYRDVQEVTLVDLDPEMVKLCSTNPVLRKLNQNSFADARVSNVKSPGITDAGFTATINQEVDGEQETRKGRTREKTEAVATVQVYNVDADLFIGRRPGKWDVVIVDLPDPNSVELAKLYSRQFYKKVRNVLSENGVIVVQSTSPFHAKETFCCINRTMRAAGLTTKPYHTNVYSFGDWGFILAWKNQLPSTVIEQRLTSLQEFPVPVRWINPGVMRAEFAFGNTELTSQYHKVSTLMDPVVLDYYTHDGWKTD